jgi:GR25 family glycosyltransferase involved in LPS biosynthesis
MFSRIINLDKRTDRWDVMKRFVEKNPGLQLQRFSAISPSADEAKQVVCKSLHSTFLDNWPRYSSDELKGLGAVGCFLSHRTLWQKFLESSSTVALILEDDLDSNDIDKLSEVVFPYIKDSNWDFVLLGWVGTLGDPRKHFTGTHAYMLNRAMATQLLRYSSPINQQVDYYMNAVIKASSQRMNISPYRLRQASSRSDILTFVWLDILAITWGILCILIILYYFFNSS